MVPTGWAKSRASIARRVAVSAGLCVLFVFLYGSANEITHHRHDVGQAFFEFERHLPVVPLMIVPYMSIDVFFALAPLLCRTRGELSVHARRISLAVLLAYLCFIAFPLTLGVDRPKVGGPLGGVFAFLYAFDRPYNLAPSLHIALRSILWMTYGQLTRGAARPVVGAWFILIGLSTVLTMQHHLLDVALGNLLGWFCIFVVREETGWRSPPTRGHARIAARYLAGALGCMVAGWLMRPWGIAMLWPGLALALQAAAYWTGSAAMLGKMNGRMDAGAWVLLWPWRVGASLAQWRHRWGRRPWDAVAAGVVVGRRVSRAEADELRRRGVSAVLDLTGEYPEPRGLRGLAYLNVPLLDLVRPDEEDVARCVAFIRERRARGDTVYVHCAVGYGRCVEVVAAYLADQRSDAGRAQAAAWMRGLRDGRGMAQGALGG